MPANIIQPPVAAADDGVPYRVANMFPKGVLAQYVAVGDDVANGTKYGDTNRFHIVSTSVEQVPFTWQYIDTVWMGGGQISAGGQAPADWVSMRVYAPATVGTSNPGSGAYDKVAIGGGLNVFVPAPSVDGDWDLNLTEKLNANVDFTKVNPVPAGGAGWFDYDYDTHVCTLNADQKGGYNLIDGEVTLGRQVVKVPLCQLQLTVAEVVAKPMLPHWKYEITVDHGSTEELNVCWIMFIGRRDIS